MHSSVIHGITNNCNEKPALLFVITNVYFTKLSALAGSSRQQIKVVSKHNATLLDYGKARGKQPGIRHVRPLIGIHKKPAQPERGTLNTRTCAPKQFASETCKYTIRTQSNTSCHDGIVVVVVVRAMSDKRQLHSEFS